MVFRYPVRALMGDYLRATIGVALGAGMLLGVAASPVVLLIFGGLTVLFLTFGLWTINRHVATIDVTDDYISSRGLVSKILPWPALERLKLRYFGVRRQSKSGASGFMQLTLRGGGTKLTFESSLEGFEFIAWRAAKAMRDNAASLDPTSAGNLLALGIDADGDGPPPGGTPALSGYEERP